MNKELKKEIKKFADPVRSSAHKFGIVIGIIIVIAILGLYFLSRAFFVSIANWVELVQAILVCSTALVGLSGLMILEARKIDAGGLLSQDGLERIQAVNAVSSLAKAEVFLQWSVFFSIISIIASSLCIMTANVLLLIVSLVTFGGQLYFFMFGLIFSDFVPS